MLGGGFITSTVAALLRNGVTAIAATMISASAPANNMKAKAVAMYQMPTVELLTSDQ